MLFRSFEQPHAGDVLQKARRSLYSPLVREVMLERFFRHDRRRCLDAHQTPGTAAQIRKMRVLRRDGKDGRYRIMSGNRYDRHFPDTRFLGERISEHTDRSAGIDERMKQRRRKAYGCQQ